MRLVLKGRKQSSADYDMGYHTHLYHNEHKLSLSHAVATWANTTPLNKRQNSGIH